MRVGNIACIEFNACMDFLCGACRPGRDLVRSSGKTAQNGFVAKGRAILATVKPPGVADTDYKKYVLRFIEEGDVDPVATRKLWKNGIQFGDPDFLKGCVEPLLEQHMFAFRGQWPADVPLAPIVTHRLVRAMGSVDSPVRLGSVQSAPSQDSSPNNRYQPRVRRYD